MWLDADKELLSERLGARHHEYMNPKLLDSQFATLEPPKDALHMMNDRPPAEIVDQILEHVSLTAGGPDKKSGRLANKGRIKELTMAGLFDLTGKTAVVVGGTSGIGLAMALGLADAGADVVASSRRQEQVDEAAKQIESRGRRSLRVASDVADRKSLQALCDATIGAFGKVDILINSAGKIKRAPTVDFPEDEWNSISWTRT